jgi:hypothetical protein
MTILLLFTQIYVKSPNLHPRVYYIDMAATPVIV